MQTDQIRWLKHQESVNEKGKPHFMLTTWDVLRKDKKWK